MAATFLGSTLMSSKAKADSAKGEAAPVLLPKFRFPEFRGREPWKPVTLEEASTPVTERVGERKLTPVSISAGIGFVPQAEKFGRDISGNQYQLYTLVSDGDFVFNKGNSLKFPQGCVYQLKGWGQVAAPNVFICFRLKKGYSDGFFQQCFEQNQHGRQLKRDITSGARSNGLLNISKETFFGVEIPTPSLIEQQKIAECLSSLDELIAAQARKVDALKTHKKGLIQQLFPREGETQPCLRFPEFKNSGNWEAKPLREVFSIFQGFAFSSRDSVEQGCRWLKIADVGIQLMNHEAPSFLPDAYKERFAKFSVRKGDYVIALTRPILGRQLKIAEVDDIFDSALLNQRVGKLTTIQYPAFVFFLLQTWKLIDAIEKSISGNDPPNLSAQQIEGIVTYVPRLGEQQRIASCLSSLDALISVETQKLEALKTHKKGLMQQLFPSPEEVEA